MKLNSYRCHRVKYLLNSDSLSCLFLPETDSDLLENLKHYSQNQDISVLTGDWKKFLHQQGKYGSYLGIKYSEFCLLDDGKQSELWHEIEREYLIYVGRGLNPVYCIISSIAVVYDLILVTNNIGNFQNFQDLNLKIEICC